MAGRDYPRHGGYRDDPCPALCQIQVIAAFGHRQGDDANGRIGHRGDQRTVTIGNRQIIDHRADHLGRATGRVQLDQRAQPVLRGQKIAHGGVIGAYARTDDGPVLRQPLLHQPVRIPGLMRTVEIAQTDMNDAGSQSTAVIGRTQDRGRQIGQDGI